MTNHVTFKKDAVLVVSGSQRDSERERWGGRDRDGGWRGREFVIFSSAWEIISPLFMAARLVKKHSLAIVRVVCSIHKHQHASCSAYSE